MEGNCFSSQKLRACRIFLPGRMGRGLDLAQAVRLLTPNADGHVATLVSGTVIRREGQDTGARPGKLARNAGI